MTSRDIIWIALGFVLGALFVFSSGVPARAERMGGPGLSVYDGDTFSIGKKRYRVAGVDAPEIGWRARCPYEGQLAIKAREEVRAFMQRPYRLKSAPGRDRWGRTLIVVQSDGKSLTAHLIEMGLGVAYNGKGKRPDWCAMQRISK